MQRENNKANNVNPEKNNPLVKLSIDKYEGETNPKTDYYLDDSENMMNDIKKLNINKHVVTKNVEITTKITYTFSDGTTREVQEKNSHNYHYN